MKPDDIFMTPKNWLFSSGYDFIILFLPVWLTWLVAFLIPTSFIQADLPIWVWVIFVIGIDVSHVWSTIFRTYLDKNEFSNHRKLLIISPIVAFILAGSLAYFSIDLFWRCLAYVAVFHFIKQQYGFMRIYKAKASDFRKKVLSDNLVIYISMLYPVIYWHFNPDRNFEWFTEGDFIQYALPQRVAFMINRIGSLLYFGIMGFWLAEELYHYVKTKKKLAAGKILWVLTTCGNWYIGIVYFNSDLIFTLTNVVAHGVPYLALIIFYEGRKRMLNGIWLTRRSWLNLAGTIVTVVLIFAYIEEFLWNQWVYQEANVFFDLVREYPFWPMNDTLKVLALSLLSVPQITHYIVDGYIWKGNKNNPHLKQILLP